MESLHVQKVKLETKNIANIMYMLCLERLHSNLEKQKIQNYFQVFQPNAYLILQKKNKDSTNYLNISLF